MITAPATAAVRSSRSSTARAWNAALPALQWYTDKQSSAWDIAVTKRYMNSPSQASIINGFVWHLYQTKTVNIQRPKVSNEKEKR